MADRTELGLPVLVTSGTSHAPRLVCVAGIHGNEPEGIMALLELWDEIEPSDVAGRLVLVPAANPSAFRAGERRNPEDPLDMNRIFPAARRNDHRRPVSCKPASHKSKQLHLTEYPQNDLRIECLTLTAAEFRSERKLHAKRPVGRQALTGGPKCPPIPGSDVWAGLPAPTAEITDID